PPHSVLRLPRRSPSPRQGGVEWKNPHVIAIPAFHRAADTLAGAATPAWCASITVTPTDRTSSAATDSEMSPFIACLFYDRQRLITHPAPRITASRDSHAIHSA